MPRKTDVKTTSSITVDADSTQESTARPKRARNLKAQAVSPAPGSDDPDLAASEIVAAPAPAASPDNITPAPQVNDHADVEASALTMMRKPPFSPTEGDALKVPKPGTKGALIVGLLSREAGATVAELQAATGWLPHTTRAALTGFRKRGHVLAGSKSPGGDRRYRILSPAPATGACEDSSTDAGEVQ